eukprot:scaffold40737_cov42-Cyclotella_meneghiniana.AAC.7
MAMVEVPGESAAMGRSNHHGCPYNSPFTRGPPRKSQESIGIRKKVPMDDEASFGSSRAVPYQSSNSSTTAAACRQYRRSR